MTAEDKQKVRERLTANRAVEDAEYERAGREAGRLWAMEVATAREVDRLHYLDAAGCDRDDLGAWLAERLTGRELCDGHVCEFWEAAGAADDEMFDEVFLRGFLAGGQEVARAVLRAD